MPSRKSRPRSKGTALSNGRGGAGERAGSGSPAPTHFFLSSLPLFLVAAAAVPLAIAVRWAAFSPYFLFSIGPFEETGHYEGSPVYDRVYRGVSPSLKCTWSRNFCRAYVRVESCPVRPKEYDGVRSIADQVRYMDRHGPNAFHLRVVGGWDIQALSVVDFAVSRVANAGDDACLYTSRLIDLRTPGEVTFELWHMYANFTGWKILNPGSVFNPSETMQYPAKTFSGFETQQIMTHPPVFYTVPMAFSIGLRSSFLSYAFDRNHRKAFRVVSAAQRVSSASRKALCGIEEIHPGAWMADLVISANITHPDSSACFERMRRFGPPSEEIFDDCIRSMRFVPKSCDIARYGNERMRHLLHHGGVGPVVRGAHSASKARRMILVGDSHMRFLAYGLLYRLAGNESKEQAQFRLPLVKDFSPVSLVGEVELRYCLMKNPAAQLIEECLAALKFGGDDILVAGSAAWPLATAENGQIQNPQEYRVGVQGVRDVLVSALGAFPALKIFWMSSIAKPLTDSYYWQSVWDHRNDGLNSMLNDIARGAFVNTPVKIFDVFNLTLPMNIASVDNAHYNLFVAKEMVDVLLSDIVT